jgi:hypothetical protein
LPFQFRDRCSILLSFKIALELKYPLGASLFGDLERDHLGGAQSRTVGHSQRGLVLQPRRGIEQPRHFLDAEHHRQLARLVNEMGALDDIVAFERDLKRTEAPIPSD